MAKTSPPYIIDKTSVRREGRELEVTTLTDISPEVVLVQKMRLHIAARQAGVPIESRPLPSTWRKRLAHVTEA